MRTIIHFQFVALLLLAISFSPGIRQNAMAATAEEISHDVSIAMKNLYATTPAAKKLSSIAHGVLVFPSIVKGGFIVGGQYGEGALLKNGKLSGYYNTAAVSYGLQAGLQKFGYALFFLDKESLEYLNKSEGFELGIGPNITVVDEGIARSLSTTTAKEGIYAFFFDQKGLMGGLGIQGSKISKINPQ